MPRQDFIAFRKSQPRAPRLERQTVRVRGLQLAVWSSPPVSDQPPLLCINGGMLYDHSMLWPALSPLAHTRQVVLYDQRGRGASQAPAAPLEATIHDDAADVGALRRALGVRRWDVIGHSWGGGIAMLAAATDPAGTRRLVLVDAVGPTSEWMAPLRENVLRRLHGEQHAAVAVIEETALGQPDPELHARYARAVYPAWFHDPDLAAFFLPPKVTSVTGAAALAKLRSAGYDWRAQLRAVSCTTLVIHGEQDPLPRSAADQIAALIPGSRKAFIPTSGHMPFWESPAPFFSLAESFLASPNPATLPTHP